MPRPLANPCVNVVFPEPSSPERAKTSAFFFILVLSSSLAKIPAIFLVWTDEFVLKITLPAIKVNFIFNPKRRQYTGNPPDFLHFSTSFGGFSSEFQRAVHN